MRFNTFSCTIVGGLFFGRMVLTSTLSTKSWLATSTWKRCPQFLTQVSKTCRSRCPRESPIRIGEMAVAPVRLLFYPRGKPSRGKEGSRGYLLGHGDGSIARFGGLPPRTLGHAE